MMNLTKKFAQEILAPGGIRTGFILFMAKYHLKGLGHQLAHKSVLLTGGGVVAAHTRSDMLEYVFLEVAEERWCFAAISNHQASCGHLGEFATTLSERGPL